MTATFNPPNAVLEWRNVFLAQGTENFTSSVTFMKQLTVVALSTITYMKNTFPENNYTVATFGGLKLKILKKKCEDELAHFLSTSLTQAFEAFEKKYLHQLVLCFYENECNMENLVEYYIFEYTYNPEGVSMNVHSKTRNNEKKSLKCTFEDIERQTTNLIRTCVVMMQACQSFSQPSDISLRLYYNDDAPEDYQAPGYSSCSVDHIEPTLQQALKMGSVDTPYHKVVARSYIKDMFPASHEAIASQNPPVMFATQDEFGETASMSVASTPTNLLRCPCNTKDTRNYKQPLFVTCRHCETIQHAACFGLLSKDSEHCCTDCSDKMADVTPTDTALANLSARKRECLCIFRRTLDWCCDLASIDVVMISQRFDVTITAAMKLMKTLHSYGVVLLDGDNDKSPKKINIEQLKSCMSKYFHNSEDRLTDKLIAESMGSQESQPDPIAQVLSPMEKIHLANASHMGRVISGQDNKGPGDAALQQYKEALFTTDNDKELPLSGSHNPVQDVDKVSRDVEMKCSLKRKATDRKLRSGVKNKKNKLND